MKKIIYAFLVCLPALLISCDDNNPNDDRFGADIESGWVEFVYDSSATITGGTNQVNIPIQLKTVSINTPVNKNGFDVYYEITGTSGAQSDAINFSGAATIPAGEVMGNIVIDFPQNISTACSNYTIKLTSTNKGSVTVGLDENSITTHNLKIGGTRDSFLGSYNVVEDGEFEYVVNVTAGSQPNELILSNIYGQDPESQTSIFLESSSSLNNVRFPEFSQNLLFTSSNAAQGDFFVSNDFENYLLTASNAPADFVPSSYDPCTQKITLNFFLIYGANQEITVPANVPVGGQFAINVVMTKI